MTTVLVYSGGLDSTVLLYYLRSTGHELRCLGVDYGQRHRRELQAAERICRDAGVELRIADNGRGFVPGETPADHLGLGIMRERAEAAGARLEIESSPGQGTRLRLVWSPVE